MLKGWSPHSYFCKKSAFCLLTYTFKTVVIDPVIVFWCIIKTRNYLQKYLWYIYFSTTWNLSCTTKSSGWRVSVPAAPLLSMLLCRAVWISISLFWSQSCLSWTCLCSPRLCINCTSPKDRFLWFHKINTAACHVKWCISSFDASVQKGFLIRSLVLIQMYIYLKISKLYFKFLKMIKTIYNYVKTYLTGPPSDFEKHII